MPTQTELSTFGTDTTTGEDTLLPMAHATTTATTSLVTSTKKPEKLVQCTFSPFLISLLLILILL